MKQAPKRFPFFPQWTAAIVMLNVSATQELARNLEAQQKENTALKKRLAELEARERKREALFTRMEELLESDARARTASARVAPPVSEPAPN